MLARPTNIHTVTIDRIRRCMVELLLEGPYLPCRSAPSLTPRDLTSSVQRGGPPHTHGATLPDRAGRLGPGSYRAFRLTFLLVPLLCSEFTAIAHHLLSYSTRVRCYRTNASDPHRTPPPFTLESSCNIKSLFLVDSSAPHQLPLSW